VLELELMEGGHMLPVTAPDRCAALVGRVADRLTGTPVSGAGVRSGAKR
jgi:hypothetical protein